MSEQSAQIIPVSSIFTEAMEGIEPGATISDLGKPANRGEKILVLARNKGTGRVILSIPSVELSIVRHPGEFHWDKSQQRLVDEGGEPYACIGHYVGVLPMSDQGRRAVALHETLPRYKKPNLNLSDDELKQFFKDEENIPMLFAALAADETLSPSARAQACVNLAFYRREVPISSRETMLLLQAFSSFAEARVAEALNAEEASVKEQLRA